MEKILVQNLLYDFYGELLTKHQQNVYEDAILGDMSLAEVAQNYSITRQGVHDLIKRCDKLMNDYEDKLQLIKKFTSVKNKVQEINTITLSMQVGNVEEKVNLINQLAEEILEEL